MTEGITREQNTTSWHEDEGLMMPAARLAVVAKGQAVQHVTWARKVPVATGHANRCTSILFLSKASGECAVLPFT